MVSEVLINIWKRKAQQGDEFSIGRLKDLGISLELPQQPVKSQAISQNVSTNPKQTIRPRRNSDGKRRTIYIKDEELWERAVKTGNVSKLIAKLLELYFKRKDKQVNQQGDEENG